MSKTFLNETVFDWDDQEDDINYTTVDNYIFDNNNIEFNSQGIYLQIVRFKNSKKHKVYMSGLESTGKGSKRDIQRGILNLRMEGFLIREVIREQGRFKGYSYKIRRNPLSLTTEQKLEIYNENKINKEYAKKVYGDEFVLGLEKYNTKNTENDKSNVSGKNTETSLNHCDTSVSTESTNCDIGNCDIRNCAAKKENGLKKKIFNKENKDDDASASIDKSIINKFCNKWTSVTGKKIKLTTKQIVILSQLLEAHAENDIFETIEHINNSTYLKENIKPSKFLNHETFVKIYNGEYNDYKKVSVKTSDSGQLASKNPHFTTTYRHNWNHEELDDMAQDYLERQVYGDLTD